MSGRPETAALEPCPFCGAPLTIRAGVNAYGRCDTEGCWVASRAIIVPFDDPKQVVAWNTRAPTDLERELADHIAEQITHVEQRIRDGREMGASIWRIALEDVARENRALLAKVRARDGGANG
ncbi:MAG TPA: hypothetical protein VD768_08775 [Sphingomicrobium sp.]|nr:hypothetical protein [Sphingomicrobium sp.]